MLENRYKQITISEHISLYDKIIPKDHFLRKLKEVFPSKPYDAATLEEEIEYTKKLVENLKQKITDKTDKKIQKRKEQSFVIM